MEALFSPPKKIDLWYREPWMLLVIGGPLVVVIAAICTGVIAWRTNDKVISSDYYRQGLHINQDLQKDAKARLYNMQAQIGFVAEQAGVIELQLSGAAKQPPIAQLHIASSGNGNYETEAVYKITLQKVRPGLYRAALPAQLLIDKGAWHVKLIAEDWRLTGRWQQHNQQILQLTASN